MKTNAGMSFPADGRMLKDSAITILLHSNNYIVHSCAMQSEQRWDMTMLTTDQSALLAFIRGEGHHYGKGITSHTIYGSNPDWEGQRKLHQACLELEAAGVIYRISESKGCVVWMPTEAD